MCALKKKDTKVFTNRKSTKKTKIKKYYTLDNRRRPFRIDIIDNLIKIYKCYWENESCNYKHILTYTPQTYFIGKSPKNNMTLYSGCFGAKFYGNSFLLHLNDNKYIHIGANIYSFKAKNKIIDYVSPVGNNDVPYPYAIDENNRIYLMIQDVILENGFDTSKYDNPYDYYYANNTLLDFRGIQNFRIGTESYNFTFNPFPKENYTRITTFNENKKDKLYIKINGKNKLLNKTDYISLLNDFSKEKGYTPLKKKIIQKRL